MAQAETVDMVNVVDGLLGNAKDVFLKELARLCNTNPTLHYWLPEHPSRDPRENRVGDYKIYIGCLPTSDKGLFDGIDAVDGYIISIKGPEVKGELWVAQDYGEEEGNRLAPDYKAEGVPETLKAMAKFLVHAKVVKNLPGPAMLPAVKRPGLFRRLLNCHQ